MPKKCRLYYITDRKQFPGNESARRRELLAKIAEAALAGVDYIQLREKDLPARELQTLAQEAAAIVRENTSRKASGQCAQLLINSRTDIAIAAGAGGVHLRSDDIGVRDVRNVCEHSRPQRSDSQASFLVGVSCHRVEEAERAARDGADFVVFGPVFEKKEFPGTTVAGLDALSNVASAVPVPVFALGGVTLANASATLRWGAAGIAGIRLFQQNDIFTIVETLRGLDKRLGSTGRR